MSGLYHALAQFLPSKSVDGPHTRDQFSDIIGESARREICENELYYRKTAPSFRFIRYCKPGIRFSVIFRAVLVRLSNQILQVSGRIGGAAQTK